MQVSAKHFIDALETNIIQIARALSIEYEIKVDPDAKKMTREVVQNKANQLLSDKEREGLKQLWEETKLIISGRGYSTTMNPETYARYVYEALKTAGFDDVQLARV